MNIKARLILRILSYSSVWHNKNTYIHNYIYIYHVQLAVQNTFDLNLDCGHVFVCAKSRFKPQILIAHFKVIRALRFIYSYNGVLVHNEDSIVYKCAPVFPFPQLGKNAHILTRLLALVEKWNSFLNYFADFFCNI